MNLFFFFLIAFNCIDVSWFQKVRYQEKFRRSCISRASEPFNLIMNIMDPTMRPTMGLLSFHHMIPVTECFVLFCFPRVSAHFFRDPNGYLSLKKPDTPPLHQNSYHKRCVVSELDTFSPINLVLQGRRFSRA